MFSSNNQVLLEFDLRSRQKNTRKWQIIICSGVFIFFFLIGFPFGAIFFTIPIALIFQYDYWNQSSILRVTDSRLYCKGWSWRDWHWEKIFDWDSILSLSVRMKLSNVKLNRGSGSVFGAGYQRGARKATRKFIETDLILDISVEDGEKTYNLDLGKATQKTAFKLTEIIKKKTNWQPGVLDHKSFLFKGRTFVWGKKAQTSDPELFVPVDVEKVWQLFVREYEEEYLN